MLWAAKTAIASSVPLVAVPRWGIITVSIGGDKYTDSVLYIYLKYNA